MADQTKSIDTDLADESLAAQEGDAVDAGNPDPANVHEGELVEFEGGADTLPVPPAELAAIHTDTEAASEASGETVRDIAQSDEPAKPATKKTSAKPVKTKQSGPKQRSQRYQASLAKLGDRHRFSAKEALELAKETSYSSFNGAIELHVRLSAKRGKVDPNDRYRTMIALPHGAGKEPTVLVLDEALIDEIKKRGDTTADILLASPALMPKVAQIAKILGPKGKMPNPKTGTVTDDPDAAKKAILSGRVELRADAQGAIHQAIGRVSWPVEKLVENFQAILSVLPSHRLQSVSVSATMGPGIPVDLTA